MMKREQCRIIAHRRIGIFTAIVLLLSSGLFAQNITLDSLLRRHIELRFGIFMHFNMNTYYGGWANDRQNPKLFNPTNLDCAQWASTAKAAGMKYGVLTAKHHDGFTIWPSKQTPPNGKSQYTIAQSSTPSLDVVKSYTDAFRAAGLLPGLYMSMWDVANGVNGWSAAEKTFVMGQITELLGGTYGTIPILMIDGWAWKMGHKTIPYQQIRDTVKKLQPECLLVDHNGQLYGPWEEDVFYVEEPKGIYCPDGNTQAACQAPTISGNWFWDANAASSSALMSLSTILDHLTKLEPRYCNFMLNCPPNKSGVMDQAIVDRLAQIGSSWKPNASRAPLPKQPFIIEHPITPSSATGGTNPGNAIDGVMDYGSEKDWTGSVNGTITIDLGSSIQNVGIFGYLPNQNGTVGEITGYTIATSTDNSTFTTVRTGTWAANRNPKVDTFPRITARYVRLTVSAVNSGTPTASEMGVGTRPPDNSSISGDRTMPMASSLFSGNTTYRITGDRFVIPRQFAGKTVAVTVYDVSGKRIMKEVAEKGVIDLGKRTNSANKVRIVNLKVIE